MFWYKPRRHVWPGGRGGCLLPDTPAMDTPLDMEVEDMEGEGDLKEGCSRIVDVLGAMVVIWVEKVIDQCMPTERCINTRQAMKPLARLPMQSHRPVHANREVYQHQEAARENAQVSVNGRAGVEGSLLIAGGFTLPAEAAILLQRAFEAMKKE
jgi:hypothetical protein